MAAGVLGCVALLASAAPGREGLAVAARTPIVTVVSAPPGAPPRFSQADLLAAVDDALRGRTDLVVRSADQAGMDRAELEQCEELSCWVRAALARNGEGYLLVLVLHSPAHRPARLSALLVDLRRADPTAPSGEDAALGLRVSAPFVNIAAAGELPAVMEHLVSEQLRGELEESGHWARLGDLELAGAAEGCTVSVDGAEIGPLRAGGSVLSDVPAGTRALHLSCPGYEPYDAAVAVEAGRVTRHAPELARVAPSSFARSATLWGGVGASVLGAAVVVAAGAAAGRQASTVCYVTSGDGCPGGSFVRVAGVPGAPLGYSLLSVGTAWWVGSTFVEEDAEVPWRSLVVGVVLGAAAFGVSAAVEAGAR